MLEVVAVLVGVDLAVLFACIADAVSPSGSRLVPLRTGAHTQGAHRGMANVTVPTPIVRVQGCGRARRGYGALSVSCHPSFGGRP
ncbi:MAG TPA: hypothetical protein VMV22_14200 [Acidimicrobiales bacterium]|nr:hypothetical protein [Acidimicrobiales bacterium]